MKTHNKFALQAISTKYIPTTNSRGSRIKAHCERGSITIGYPLDMSGSDCHEAAVIALLEKFAKADPEGLGTWGTIADYAIGGTAEGYVFVRV
jgi:hypothetical protein